MIQTIASMNGISLFPNTQVPPKNTKIARSSPENIIHKSFIPNPPQVLLLSLVSTFSMALSLLWYRIEKVKKRIPV